MKPAPPDGSRDPAIDDPTNTYLVHLIGRLLLTAKRIAAEHGLPGYRVAMNVNREGGQVVFHVHQHVLGGRPLKGALG